MEAGKESELDFLLPEDAAFRPKPKEETTIAHLCHDVKEGKTMVVLDMDGVLLYKLFIHIPKKHVLSIVASPQKADFFKSNIKFYLHLLEVITGLKAKGIYVTLATCCPEQSYVTEVIRLLDEGIQGQAFDAFIFGDMDRHKVVVRLMQDLNSKFPTAPVKDTVVVDDEIGNLHKCRDSGHHAKTGKHFVHTIHVNSPTSNQYLLDLGEHFELKLSFGVYSFNAAPLNEIYSHITKSSSPGLAAKSPASVVAQLPLTPPLTLSLTLLGSTSKQRKKKRKRSLTGQFFIAKENEPPPESVDSSNQPSPTKKNKLPKVQEKQKIDEDASALSASQFGSFE